MDGGEVTHLLKRLENGDADVVHDLLPLVYEELRTIADRHMRRERRDHTLQATALAHEAYVRLVDQTHAEWRDRAYFFGIAAQAMRRILVDHARSRNAIKRGGGVRRVDLETNLLLDVGDGAALLALDEALDRFGREHPQKARVVELRYFGGMTNDESAEILGVTTRTVERHWNFARAWLYREIAF